jgi:hypothetical protein
MTTPQTRTTEERLKRQELQMDDDDGDDTIDVDVIETRGDTVEAKPLVTPPQADRVQQSAPESGTPVPNAGFGTPSLVGQDSAQTHDRWQQIQAQFVDDPRKAVGDAHALVGDLVQRIVDTFTRERNELEGQWSKGADVSTEDLRVCLQHYREFFARLLPSANGISSHT